METNNNIENSKKEDLLSSIKKEGHFSVSKDYFDYLPGEVMSRVNLESKKKEQHFVFSPALALSSVVVLFVVSYFLFFNNTTISDAEIILSENDIEYILDNPELYDIDYALVRDEYLSSNTNYEPELDFSSISEDEVADFLEDESDLNYIINEY